MEKQELLNLKNLVLTNAIITSVAIVPFLGAVVLNRGASIVAIAIAIIILTKQKTNVVSKMPNYFAIGAGVISIIATVVSVFILGGLGALAPNLSDAEVGGILIVFLIITLIGFVAWALYFVAMIMYWMNFTKLKQLTEAMSMNTPNWSPNNQQQAPQQTMQGEQPTQSGGQPTWPANNQQQAPQQTMQGGQPTWPANNQQQAPQPIMPGGQPTWPANNQQQVQQQASQNAQQQNNEANKQ